MANINKFGRNYLLTIQTSEIGGSLAITLPFTIEFDITVNTLSSANVCQIRIYNLSEKNRDLIRFNVYDYNTFKKITLKAGYGDNLATIFTGNITQAWSVREGVNFITQIECFDGGFAFINGKTNQPISAGTPYKVAIAQIMADLPNVTVGTIGNYTGVITRGNTYSGNTADILTQLTGGGFFIAYGKANALQSNEYILQPGATLIVSSQSGLLGTPHREQTKIVYDMIFEPGLVVGTQILMASSTGANFNRTYKVTGVKHRGMISAAVCGSVITTGEFFFDKILTPAGVG